MTSDRFGRPDWLNIARCALERDDTESVRTALKMARRLRGRKRPQVADNGYRAEEDGDPASVLRNLVARRGAPLVADRPVGRWNPYAWMLRR